MERSYYFLFCLPVIFGFILIFQNNNGEGDFHVDGSQIISPITSEETKCTDCHELLNGKKLIHVPAQEACENCHQIDTAVHPEINSTGLFLTEQVPDLCFLCHDALKNDLDTTRMIHKAVSDKKQCMNCHSPHASDENKLLIAGEIEVCLACHNKVINTDGRKTTNIKDQLSKSKVIHPVLEMEGCVVCHMPHASSYNYLLTKAYPAGDYVPAKKESFEFCWQCHDSDLLEVEITTAATNFRDGDRNLHFVHMNGEKGRNCSMCHNVHASVNEHLIKDKISFGEWELPINYSATEYGGSCFPGCHKKSDYTR